MIRAEALPPTGDSSAGATRRCLAIDNPGRLVLVLSRVNGDNLTIPSESAVTRLQSVFLPERLPRKRYVQHTLGWQCRL